ncbi:acyltransferase [Patescibacteria group bacterium]|nr:acyltransferase [Patescibacteria group bacterium]
MNIVSFLKQLYLDITWSMFPVWRLKKSGAKVGNNVFIGRHCYVELENAKFLTIEDGAVLAAYSKIILHDSSLNNINGFDLLYGRVILGKNCYLGADVTVLPGSKIGKNTIVGAGSLVKGDLNDNSVYVGRPAKFISSVDDLTTKWQKIKHSSVADQLGYQFLPKKSPYLVK